MRKFFGGLLLAVGILIAGLSGLCSLASLISLASSGPGEFSSLGLVALFGGIPFLIGAALIWIGRALLRDPKP